MEKTGVETTGGEKTGGEKIGGKDRGREVPVTLSHTLRGPDKKEIACCEW